MRQNDQAPKPPRTPTKPFDPKDPSTWPQATAGDLAAMQANAGYKPLTGKKPETTPWYKQNPFGKPAYFDLSGKNMYNASGTDLLKGAANVVTGAGNALITTPLKSLNRTLSGSNTRIAVDPKSTATERINAIGEDALNILSLVPAFRAGGAVDDIVRYSDEGMAAAKQAYANFRNRVSKTPASEWTSFDVPFEEASPRLKAAIREENDARVDLSFLAQQGKVRPGIDYGNSSRRGLTRPEWKALIPEGYERFWHTNPEGSALPSKLNSMEEAARLAGRRGTGATQAFSGGIYNTNAGDMSLTYLDDLIADNPVIRDKFPSSVVPKYFVDDLMPGYGVYDKPWMRSSGGGNVYGEQIDYPTIGRDIRDLQVADFRSQFVGLNSPANSIPFRADSPYRGQDFGNMTVKELLDSVATKEEALAIINDSSRPIVFEQDPRAALDDVLKKFGDRRIDYDMKSAALNKEIRFKHPIVRGPKGGYTKTAVVNPESGLYLSGNNFVLPEMPFSESYYRQIDDLSEKWRADAIKRMQDQMKGWGRTPDEIALHMDDAFYKYIEEANPYNYFKNRDLKPKFEIGTQNIGGQNYWDLPVEKDAEGVIQSIAGLKAMDIRTSGGSKEMFNNLANEWRDFIYQNYPQLTNNQEVNAKLNALRNLYTSSTKTKGYHIIQNDLESLLRAVDSQAGIETNIFGDLTPKERFYNHMVNSGYGVIPHTGGEIMGGDVQHLALNVLQPELLPPSTYVPPGTNFTDPLGRLARAQAIQSRMFRHDTSLPNMYGQDMFKAALDRVRKSAGRAAVRSVASSNLQRIGGY